MEQCRDIRSEEVYKDAINTSLWLLRQWPQYLDASGIACLTVVLRAIYARLPKDWAQQMSHLESANRFCLTVALWGKPLSEVEQGNQATFESLINSDTLKTLWGHQEFQIFQPLLWSSDKSPGWVDYDPRNAPQDVIKRFQSLHPVPSTSTINVTMTSIASDLSDEVSKIFGQFSSDSGYSVLLRPAAPSFIYVTVNVCDTSKFNLALYEIYTLSLDCGRFETVDGGVIWKEDAETVEYTLAALVQYRQTPDGCDHVQLFDSLGHRIRPLHHPGEYADDRDSFAPGVKLFLLFAQNDHDPPKSSAKAKVREPRDFVRKRSELQRALDQRGWVRQVTPRLSLGESPGARKRKTDTVVID
ncbi:hypothetical protein NM208_g9813 [Fusarium decemcellulare]|uniref:Uncharacterized protein n=1 Tax=Fusarium decemcellulare TaxID=57161 RepID=A0ACC1S0N9_9HYPO|nr:hypothetical protein NM208_g9813 [Fusarium decemcellulare]